MLLLRAALCFKNNIPVSVFKIWIKELVFWIFLGDYPTKLFHCMSL